MLAQEPSFRVDTPLGCSELERCYGLRVSPSWLQHLFVNGRKISDGSKGSVRDIRRRYALSEILGLWAVHELTGSWIGDIFHYGLILLGQLEQKNVKKGHILKTKIIVYLRWELVENPNESWGDDFNLSKLILYILGQGGWKILSWDFRYEKKDTEIIVCYDFKLKNMG